eukprot:Awhi_evm1s434
MSEYAITFKTFDDYEKKVYDGCVGALVIYISLENLYYWFQNRKRREFFHIFYCILCLSTFLWGVSRLHTIVKSEQLTDSEKLAWDVIRSSIGVLIHPHICILLYIRAKAALIIYPKVEKFFLGLVIFGVVFSWITVIYREYLEIKYYDSDPDEDEVFNGARKKLGSALNIYAVTLEIVLIFSFAVCWKKLTQDRNDEQSRKFLIENLLQGSVLFFFSLFYLITVNIAVDGERAQEVPSFICFNAVLSLKFINVLTESLRASVNGSTIRSTAIQRTNRGSRNDSVRHSNQKTSAQNLNAVSKIVEDEYVCEVILEDSQLGDNFNSKRDDTSVDVYDGN